MHACACVCVQPVGTADAATSHTTFNLEETDTVIGRLAELTVNVEEEVRGGARVMQSCTSAPPHRLDPPPSPFTHTPAYLPTI